MNPWQAERLAATYGDERRRVADARHDAGHVVDAATRRPHRRSAATLAGQLLVRAGWRLLEVGDAAWEPPARRRADAC